MHWWKRINTARHEINYTYLHHVQPWTLTDAKVEPMPQEGLSSLLSCYGFVTVGFESDTTGSQKDDVETLMLWQLAISRRRRRIGWGLDRERMEHRHGLCDWRIGLWGYRSISWRYHRSWGKCRRQTLGIGELGTSKTLDSIDSIGVGIGEGSVSERSCVMENLTRLLEFRYWNPIAEILEWVFLYSGIDVDGMGALSS